MGIIDENEGTLKLCFNFLVLKGSDKLFIRLEIVLLPPRQPLECAVPLVAAPGGRGVGVVGTVAADADAVAGVVKAGGVSPADNFPSCAETKDTTRWRSRADNVLL
jgi:hypothetical protein